MPWQRAYRSRRSEAQADFWNPTGLIGYLVVVRFRLLVILPVLEQCYLGAGRAVGVGGTARLECHHSVRAGLARYRSSGLGELVNWSHRQSRPHQSGTEIETDMRAAPSPSRVRFGRLVRELSRAE
jgi:hypothetical protein